MDWSTKWYLEYFSGQVTYWSPQNIIGSSSWWPSLSANYKISRWQIDRPIIFFAFKGDYHMRICRGIVVWGPILTDSCPDPPPVTTHHVCHILFITTLKSKWSVSVHKIWTHNPLPMIQWQQWGSKIIWTIIPYAAGG